MAPFQMHDYGLCVTFLQGFTQSKISASYISYYRKSVLPRGMEGFWVPQVHSSQPFEAEAHLNVQKKGVSPFPEQNFCPETDNCFPVKYCLVEASVFSLFS